MWPSGQVQWESYQKPCCQAREKDICRDFLSSRLPVLREVLKQPAIVDALGGAAGRARPSPARPALQSGERGGGRPCPSIARQTRSSILASDSPGPHEQLLARVDDLHLPV